MYATISLSPSSGLKPVKRELVREVLGPATNPPQEHSPHPPYSVSVVRCEMLGSLRLAMRRVCNHTSFEVLFLGPRWKFCGYALAQCRDDAPRPRGPPHRQAYFHRIPISLVRLALLEPRLPSQVRQTPG